MPGLQDLLLLRQLQDQADPFRSAFQSLAAGVDTGIKEAQEEAKQRKEIQKNKDAFLGGDTEVSNRFKMEESIDLSTGKIRSVIKKRTPEDIKKQEKLDLEIGELKKKLNIPSVFDRVNTAANITTELETQIPTAAPIPRVSGSIQESGGLVIPEFGPGGRPKGAVDIGATTKLKRAESKIEIEKQAEAQKAKAQELSGRDFFRASVAADTSLNEVLNFSKENFRKFGIRPGDFLGFFEKLEPKQLNKFKAAATGAGREAAALIARQIIPGVRAANITKIFAQSAAEIGNTMEGNIENVSASMGNAFGNALSTNIEIVTEDGTRKNIQDTITDPETGKKLSELTFDEKLRAINTIKNNFRDKLSRDYTLAIFTDAPEILQPQTVTDIANSLTPEEIESLLRQ